MASEEGACNASVVHETHHTLPTGLELTCVDRACGMSTENISHENLIGLGIAIGANAVIPLALNLQKLAHTQNADDDGNPRKPMTQLPMWWLGLFLMIAGEFFNLLAYGFAPTSLVAPVGAVGVFFNGVIATLGMKEPFGWRDALGLIAIAGGVVMVVSAVPEVQMDDLNAEIIWLRVLPDWRAGGYFIFATSFTALWTLLVVPRYKEKYVLCYLILCAVISSVTVVASRAFSSIVTQAFATNIYNDFTSPIPYVAAVVIGATAVLSTAYLNKAMMLFGNNEVVPVYYCTFTIASVSAGALVYSEFYCMNTEKALLFSFGCSITFFGVFCVASGKAKPDKTATGTTFRRMMDDPSSSAVAGTEMRPSIDSGSSPRASQDRAIELASPAPTITPVQTEAVVSKLNSLQRESSWKGLACDIENATNGGSTLAGSLNKAGTAQILHSVISGSRSRSGSCGSCRASRNSDADSPNSISAMASAAASTANSTSDIPETEIAHPPTRTSPVEGEIVGTGELPVSADNNEFSYVPGSSIGSPQASQTTTDAVAVAVDSDASGTERV